MKNPVSCDVQIELCILHTYIFFKKSKILYITHKNKKICPEIILNIMTSSFLQLKQEFSGELVLLEDALKEERQHVQEEMKRLREELQQKHQAELSVLKAELEKEMTTKITELQITLKEEKEKLSSIQRALENDESKKCTDLKI